MTAPLLTIMNKLVLEGKGSVKETALSVLCDIGKLVQLSCRGEWTYANICPCSRIASENVLGQVILTYITLLQQQNLVIKGLAYAQVRAINLQVVSKPHILGL
jgi:hypothetical protein